MANPMRIRAEIRDGLTEVRLLIPHPMESGQRKDENGAPIPAHFITALEIFHRERLVFGASDPQAGCAGSVYRIPEDPAFSHFCRCEGGLLADECMQLLQSFFKKRRGK